MYSNVVLNIFNNPKNAGRMKKPEGVANCYNEDKTSHVEFFLRIESGIITDCKFRAQANPYIIAICSTMANIVKGKMCSMIFLDPYSIKAELGDETPIDIMFCIDCMKLAIQDYKEKLEKTTKQSKKEANDEDSIDEIDKELESEMTDVVEEESMQNLKDAPSLVENEEDPDDDFDFSDFFDDI